MFLDLLLSDNNSKYKGMNKLELIQYMKTNFKFFALEDNLLYEKTGNTKELIFSKDKLNQEAVRIFLELINTNTENNNL
jgi:hypothetical protein